MVQLKINGEERRLEDADEAWIAREFQGRRQAGEPVCVQVRINCDGLHIRLSTPTCGGGGFGGRPPITEEERHILLLWSKFHLDTPDFTPGGLIAFLKQIDKLVPC